MGGAMEGTATTTDNLGSLFAGMAYRWPLRRYQQLALDAFDQARATGRQRAYVVLPPGSGKTVLGLEIARRLGRRTLVLCPNTAVQAQWLREWQHFAPPCVAATAESALGAPLAVLTYQALCTFDASDPSLDQPADHQEGDATLGAQTRQDRRLDRRRARALIARGGTRAQLLSLLHPHGREVVERMKRGGPWTLVLDECHHLLEMWGYLVRALLEEVGEASPVFVAGLTATPPIEMSAREAALYRELFGTADFEVATPAVVKEGELAPYQELAYLTLPAAHEARYIAEQQARFQQLTVRLLDFDFSSLSFVSWLRRRVDQRRLARRLEDAPGSADSHDSAGAANASHLADLAAATSPMGLPGLASLHSEGPRLSWAQFERDEPALALAALRFFFHHHLPPPPDAHLREPHRRPMTADDWVALIQDYCLGHLKASEDPRDEAAWEEIRRALPALGYVLTRQGIRRSASPVDRVLSLSASKGAAALEILATEQRALGARLRALVLCDYESAGYEVLAKLRGVLDPRAGSAALWLHILLSDPAAAALDPILVTGKTVACGRRTAVDLCRWIEAQAPPLSGTVATEHLFDPVAAVHGRDERSWEDVLVVRPASAWWQPRHYVPLLTRYFEQGRSRCLVGTRGLLGEGWDAKTTNVLIDLTAAGTSTAVHQMRGRSARLDPSLPRKVANNWDVICVAPEHPQGLGDYARFVRKHQHYFALTAESEIESGVSHVDPRLSPFGPPPRETFEAINQAMLARPQERERAYAAWRIGEPYRNVEAPTVRIKFERELGVPHRNLLRHASAESGTRGGYRGAGLPGALARLFAISAAQRLRSADTIEDLAAALVEALCAASGIETPLGPPAVRLTVQSDGYYRCSLAGAAPAESKLFAESLEELLAPLASPRYLIPRAVIPAPRSTWQALLLLIRLRLGHLPRSLVVYHAVPDYLAANRERVELFRRSWNRYVGRGTPLYYQDPRAQAILELHRGEDPFRFASQFRTLWT